MPEYRPKNLIELAYGLAVLFVPIVTLVVMMFGLWVIADNLDTELLVAATTFLAAIGAVFGQPKLLKLVQGMRSDPNKDE